VTDAETKAAGAFRTIGEVSRSTGLPQHVLRYWETRFPQLKPLTRAGNRRYYRPEDVALVARIDRLLNHDGYTVKGVQKLLAGEGKGAVSTEQSAAPVSGDPLRAVRDRLKAALDAD
jgi:DNA-binding transcriptional MerR regulator